MKSDTVFSSIPFPDHRNKGDAGWSSPAGPQKQRFEDRQTRKNRAAHNGPEIRCESTARASARRPLLGLSKDGRPVRSEAAKEAAAAPGHNILTRGGAAR